MGTHTPKCGGGCEPTEGAPREKRPLTADQRRGFLEAAHGDKFEALYVLAIHCGPRQREPLGLRWDGIDLEAGTL